MSYVYFVDRKIIGKVVQDLKRENYISEHKTFHHGKKENPCEKIYYNDYGFLDSIGYYRSEETVNSILDLLKRKDMAQESMIFPEEIYQIYSYNVRNKFVVPWKSFTPTMERLVFLLSACKKPGKIIAVGVNCGYTLAWLSGYLYKKTMEESGIEIHAIEKDPCLLNIAKTNMGKLEFPCAEFHYTAGNAAEKLDNFEDNAYDMVFLDTRSDYDILTKLYHKLKPNGWLLMHNASDPHFKKEMKKYLEFVRDKRYFSESFLFRIDTKGLELSVKC